MTKTLTIFDEQLSGERSEPMFLDFLNAEITVRELIRERVHQEVKDFHRDRGKQPLFRGLVQPTDTEQDLNGYRTKRGRQIDWEAQFEKACEAFTAGRILVIVDKKQVEGLEERFVIRPSTEVVFLKLVPLIGG
jgi:hypothetical protein